MKKAFTLAEALITLAIIGIVAAAAVPTIIRAYNTRVLETQAQKIFSEIATATTKAISDELSNDMSFDEDGMEIQTKGFYDTKSGSNCNFITANQTTCDLAVGKSPYTGAKQFLTTYFKAKTKGLDPNTGYTYKKPDETNASNKFLTPKNSYCIETTSKVTMCMYFDENATDDEEDKIGKGRSIIIFDTNGINKKPNIIGQDIFALQIKSNGELRDINETKNSNNEYKCGEKTGGEEDVISYTGGCLIKLMDNDWQL